MRDAFTTRSAHAKRNGQTNDRFDPEKSFRHSLSLGLSCRVSDQGATLFRADLGDRMTGRGALRSLVALVAALSVPLGGCLPLPYLNTTHVPDLAPHLPENFLISSEEVLVLLQKTLNVRRPDGHGYIATRVVAARFIPGRELAALSRTLALHSISGTTYYIVTPAAAGGVNETKSTEELERLCIVSRDGREMALDPGLSTWTAGARAPLEASRRARFSAALRLEAPVSFDAVAPCGIDGKVDWPRELRNRVAEFISQLPEPGAGSARSPRRVEAMESTALNDRSVAP